jgi:hypothetical protein
MFFLSIDKRRKDKGTKEERETEGKGEREGRRKERGEYISAFSVSVTKPVRTAKFIKGRGLFSL